MSLQRLLHLIVLLFFSLITYAQAKIGWDCADQKLNEFLIQKSPGLKTQVQRSNEQLNQYVKNIIKDKKIPVFASRPLADSNYIIPVVIHILYAPGEAYGTGSNISYAQVLSQIEALNAAFGRNYPLYNGQDHPAYAQDTRIRFCLARNAAPDTVQWFKGPGGIEYGVKRYEDKTQAYNHYINSSSATDLLHITHPDGTYFPFENYLNIWLVKTIEGGNNVIGYAPRPLNSGYPLDGVVMRADVFGDNTTGNNFPLAFGLTQGKILAHEMGHYLNLYHIFQGGCEGANAAGALTDACDLNGDFICDTEPALTQNVFCATDTYNTCNANYNTGTTNLDMINDYMSYADDDCMNTFTLNQAQRMWATLDLYRHQLWQPSNLASTGVVGIQGCIPPYLNAQINISSTVNCVNKPVRFFNAINGNTAGSYQWEFPGGTPSSANTNTVEVTYNTPGNYKALLIVKDATNTRQDSISFSVVTCVLDSSKLTMGNWYFGDYCSIDFSTGGAVLTDIALSKKTIHGEYAYPAQPLPFVEATVSPSDSSGKLLFYSNGVNVWNNLHQKITTSSMFGKSDINASSGLCYIPYPQHPGQYFVTGVYPNFDETASGVRTVLVDLNTNTVGPWQEFDDPGLPHRFSEYLTVVPHCNGKDYWIIARAYGLDFDNRFFCFLVTASGIDLHQKPVISIAFNQPAYTGAGYQLKANRRGNQLIITSPHPYPSADGLAALYDFDSRTGEIKNERMIPNAVGYSNIQTGTAFSPNGEYFYLMRSTNFATNGPPYWLFQYRVSDLQFNVLPAPGFYFGSAFQLGPDNQLYITNASNYLACLNNPDNWGGAVFNGEYINFAEAGFTRHAGESLPAFIDAAPASPMRPDFIYTASNCSTFVFSALCFDAYTATWNFGDGSPLQAGHVVTHTFSNAGEYPVTLTLSNTVQNFGSISKKILILPLSANITGPSSVCTNGNFPSQYFSPVIPGVKYDWLVVNGHISGPADFPYADVVWSPLNTTGMIQVSISRDNCVLAANKTVYITAGVALDWILKDSVCISDSAIALVANPAGGIFSGPGITNNIFSPLIAGIGFHTLSYYYTNETNCPAKLDKIIKVYDCNITANTDCERLFNNIKLVSNPVLERLEILSPYHFKQVQVFNMLGQKVAEGEMTANKFHLPLLAPGSYFMKLFCNNNASRSYKFWKQ